MQKTIQYNGTLAPNNGNPTIHYIQLQAIYTVSTKKTNTISNVSGNFNALNFQPTNIPTTKISAGTKGEITYDENYVYLCVADNVWKRLPSADF